MMQYTYLLINLGSLLIPFVFSFHPELNFHKVWKPFFKATVCVAVPFLVWDIYFTEIGIWGFSPQYLIGVNLFNLPLEEVLFFICIPYASIFVYHCFSIFFEAIKGQVAKKITFVLIIATALVLWFNFSHLYTVFTFLGCLFLLVFAYLTNPRWLGIFYLSFLVVLIPFFIVNGLLTGILFDPPVVWYNDAENMGIRMASIPVEDAFYALLMLLGNAFLFERFKQKKAA